jgi:hypothetical protein
MSAPRHLTVIDTHTGEVIEAQDPLDEVKALRASLARQEKIITALRNDKARARKEYARRATVEEQFEAWQRATGKTRSRLTDDRFDAIRGLLEMKEPYTPEQWKLMLAGLEHYPFVVYGTRRSTGSEESRKVDIGYVCEKGARFEELANLGARVLREQAA